MQLVIHLIRRDTLALRPGLTLYAAAILFYLTLISTGFAHEFYRTQSQPLFAILIECIATAIHVIPVMLAAMIAMSDSPRDEEAHWRVLPFRLPHILTAKLLIVSGILFLPLAFAKAIGLFVLGLQAWIIPTLWDLLSSMPAWLVLGFAVGGLSGTWKRFALVMVAIIAGTAMTITGLESIHGYGLNPLERGLQGFLTTNVYLPAAVGLLLLVYLTQFSTRVLMGVFAITLIATCFFLPSMTRSAVPIERAERFEVEPKITATIPPPDSLLSITNLPSKRIARLSYADLELTGLTPPAFAVPLRLESVLLAEAINDDRKVKITSSSFEFPGSVRFYAFSPLAPDFLERHVALPSAVPTLDVINRPYEAGDGFNLFELDTSNLIPYAGTPVDINASLHLQIGSYEKLAELPLRENAATKIPSGKLYLARIQPQVSGRTQILLNELYLHFLGEIDHPYSQFGRIPPSRDPERLRYIIVNRKRMEACLPVKDTVYRGQRLTPVSIRSVIVDFAIPIDDKQDEALSDEWLAEAHIEVFRRMPRGRVKVSLAQRNIQIDTLPVVPFDDETKTRYR